MTEPEAGTDFCAMRAKLEIDGDSLLLNGNKCFVTNTGPDMESGVLTFCECGGKEAAVYVPSSSEGFHLAHRYRFAGWDNLPNHAVVLQDCVLPGNHLVREDMSEAHWGAFFSGPRLLVAAMAAGLCRACLEETMRYANRRVQCGRRLAEHQALRFRLADMATSLEIMKAGVRSAALKLDAGRECLEEIDMLKLFATTHAEWTASSAMEMAGGYGYTEDSRLSGLFRDAKGLQLYWGSRERMRMDIAASLYLYGS